MTVLDLRVLLNDPDINDDSEITLLSASQDIFEIFCLHDNDGYCVIHIA